MPKLDLDVIPAQCRTTYPAPYDSPLAGRWHKSLSDAAGLADFGIRHVRLEPGAWSAQRHWHEGEDEFVVMLSGEAVLVEDEGRTKLYTGDCAAFPKDVANGHHLINESDAPCIFLAFGRNSGKDCHYPDVDLHADGATDRYFRKDGSPY